MALRLIVGAANAGKTGRLVSRLLAGAADSQAVLAFPSVPDARRASRELAEKRTFGVRAVVFDAWVGELWALHGDGSRAVEPPVRSALIDEAVRNARLDLLGPSSATPGFTRVVEQIAARMVEPPRPRGRVADELSVILGHYETSLEARGLIEPNRAAMVLASRPPALDGPLGINRFTHLSAAQERLLVAFSANQDVTVALTWRAGSEATHALDPLVARLGTAGATIEVVDERAWTDPGLEALADALFEQGPALPVPTTVRVVEVGAADTESVAAASAARTAVERGEKPERVVIAFREAGRRISGITAALRDQGLEPHVDIARDFDDTPFGSAVSALLDAVAERGEPRERLLAFLLSPYSGADAHRVAGQDRRWRAQRTSARSMVDSVARESSEPGRLVHAARLITRGGEARDAIDGWKKLALRMLANAATRRGTDGPEAELDAAAHRALLGVVSQIFGADIGGLGERAVARALGSTRVAVGEAGSAGRVLVTEAQRLRGRRFDTVVLGGLTATEYPAEGQQSAVADALEALGQPVPVEERLLERMSFHSIITRARSNLVLIRQTLNEKGEEIRPAVFLEEVLDVYRSAEQARAGETPQDVFAAGPPRHAAIAFTPGRAALRGESASFRRPAPPRRLIADEEALDRLSADREYGLSEVEAYLRCPYHWFRDRVVRPVEVDREFGARERGSMAHAVIAAFYELWSARGHRRVVPALLDEALEVLQDVEPEALQRAGGNEAMGLAEELSVARALAWARRTIIEDATFLPEFEPVAHEWRFGAEAGRRVDIAGVSLKGSIDRIDANGEGLVVTDYKSSASLKGFASFERGGLLQIPIYLAVASRALDSKPLGGVYRSLKNGSVRGLYRADHVIPAAGWSARDAVDSSGIEGAIRAAEQRLTHAVASMRAGLIEPDPSSDSVCEYCAARATCRRYR